MACEGVDGGSQREPLRGDECLGRTRGWMCLKPKGHAGPCGLDEWVGPVEPRDPDVPDDIPAGD